MLSILFLHGFIPLPISQFVRCVLGEQCCHMSAWLIHQTLVN